jgi:hypothetical protein
LISPYDAVKPPGELPSFDLRSSACDRHPGHIRGEVFAKLYASDGRVEDERHLQNLIVTDMSILLARLVRDPAEPGQGLYVLALGTGDTGWDPLNPPAPTVDQRSLYGEIGRKTFSETRFVDALGSPTTYPTNIVDLTATFAEAEAVGPLVEMGLIGGSIDTNLAVRRPILPPSGAYDPTVDHTQYETLANYLTFPVISKPPTSTLEITWRLTF